MPPGLIAEYAVWRCFSSPGHCVLRSEISENPETFSSIRTPKFLKSLYESSDFLGNHFSPLCRILFRNFVLSCHIKTFPRVWYMKCVIFSY